MIYLIDDEKVRQEQETGWTSEVFKGWNDTVCALYSMSQINSIGLDKILKQGNTVLIHSSFKDYNHLRLSKDFKAQLQRFANENIQNFYLVEFSGGQQTRILSHNILFLPFEVFYRNLRYFLNHFQDKNIIDFNYLQFGQNPKIEKELNFLIETKNKNFENIRFDEASTKNFILKTFEIEFDEPFLNATNELFYQEDVTDEDLYKGVNQWLNNKEFDNIFIPISLGTTLSDFNGLRLATFIRCTQTINRLKPIFIYSFVDYPYLLENKYFNILKSKNIYLIDYNSNDFITALSKKIIPLSFEELPLAIHKLNLPVPKNMGDNHSIANQWGIYRWSQTINADDLSIEKLSNQVITNLYFNYLKTIYPISPTTVIPNNSLELNFSGAPKILYIDDEADLGWYEIMCEIIFTKNNIQDFYYLGDELKSKSRDEIIKLSINKIVNDDIDIVILDLRLHPLDFKLNKIENITGVQLLKEIKEKINPGIQVVVFSATNKIWNLQAIQDAGADGFVLKEAPENSVDANFTENSILHFINTINILIKKRFLKKIYLLFNPLLKKVKSNSEKKAKNYHLNISQANLIEYNGYLTSAALLLRTNYSDLKFTFLQLILVVENIVKNTYLGDYQGNHYVEVDLFTKKLCLIKKLDNIELSLSPIKKWNQFEFKEFFIDKNFDEFSYFNTSSEKVLFNYRLNCVLFFKYSVDLEKASTFSDLYRLRSNSVAHIGDRKVRDKDIIKVVELLDILIN